MFEPAGLVLEGLGIIIILVSQVVFWLRVRKKWGSLEKAFLDLTAPRWGFEKSVLVMSKTEVKKVFKLFPLAKFLYDDFKYTVVGLVVSLSGILLQFAC